MICFEKYSELREFCVPYKLQILGGGGLLGVASISLSFKVAGPTHFLQQINIYNVRNLTPEKYFAIVRNFGRNKDLLLQAQLSNT